MLKYIGNGDFIPGIPARDLSDAEVKEFGGEHLLLHSGLYAKVDEKALKPPAENKLHSSPDENKGAN